MYRCFPQPTIISMNDEPQEVIDASTSTSSTSTTSSSSTSSTAAQTTVPNGDGDDKSSSGTNIGAIVGGVVGGLAVLALLAGIAAWIILRGRRTGKNGSQTYNAVPSDPANPPMGPAQQPQQYSGGYTTLAAGGPTTFPPSSPYPVTVSAAAPAPAYDSRQSYYDANKSPAQVSQAGYTPPAHQHLFAAQPASPPVPVAGAYNPHHSVMSELDSSAASGTHGNPVEIGDK